MKCTVLLDVTSYNTKKKTFTDVSEERAAFTFRVKECTIAFP
jgi:hypothetical protein